MLHVSNLSYNLLSISKIIHDHNFRANFFPSRRESQELDSWRMIGNAKEYGGLYFSEDGMNSSKQVQSTYFESISISSDSEIMLQHYRLGHLSFQYLKYLFPKLFRNKISFSF